jgi:hypothetical protein
MLDIQKVIDQAETIAEQYLDGLTEMLEGMAFGTKEPNDEQVRQFFEMMLQRYPPAVYRRVNQETGEVEEVFDSPWMIALREPNCRGGMAIVKRIERALGR